MAGIRVFNIHYGWEDCVSMALGALIVLTAWLVGDGGSPTVAANATIVGILVLALAGSEVVDLRRWEEIFLARSAIGTSCSASLSCC